MPKAKAKTALVEAHGSPPAKAVPTLFRLESNIFYRFSQVLSRRNRALNIELRRFGLDFPRWRVLAVLNENKGCSMLRLAELTTVDRTTLAHTARVMAAEGLITRNERKSDRRSVSLGLTPRGGKVLSLILPAVLAQNEQALRGLTPEQILQLRALLVRVADNLLPPPEG